ncbi:MAG: hydroxylase [Verrucomicrobiota bacterium]
MKVYYLEIVTPDVDAAVALHSKLHGVSFSEPEMILGGARTAKLDGGGMLGIRAPLRDTEEPVVRSYYLVDDIEEAVATAAKAGAEIAMGPTELPGKGRFAIFIQGGIETGLWEESP